ncbi:MAG: class I poly(R)-hydroxyalkanoic acid synthase [Proteobacteria bacterium]|nr:class I poly(R)-hydroxyalkanoic acid synthase [Pseudomonadota bacterium]
MDRKESPFHLSFENLNKSSIDLFNTYLNACRVNCEYNKVQHATWQDIFNVQSIYKNWFSILTSDISAVSKAQSSFIQDYFKLCQNVQSLLLGQKVFPLINAQHDKRFKAKEWQENPLFYYLQQYYLLFSQHCMAYIEKHEGNNPKKARQLRFFTKQFLDAISPTNFICSNPEILNNLSETQGESITQGYNNFLKDIIDGHGHWSFKMTDMTAFEVGKNVAITPGKVVYQNRMMQLIQYSPTTVEVFQVPLLIIPPWINKFYILDISEKGSLVKWAVDAGFTVFMISWVNPDSSYRDTLFEDYLLEGILAALDAIEKVTGEAQVNALGFCIGGTLLAMTLAYLKAKNDNRIVSGTFLTTLIDFTDPGELEVFIDEEQLTILEEKMHQDGFLDGRMLMTTFNLLRPNDLFWPYYVNNYLCGKNPFAFDLLFWNCDSVNLPQKMVSYFLRNMYLNNLLVKKDALSINNINLDLSSVDTPSYFLSTEQDHIAPWKSTYAGTQLFQGAVHFVLGGSGHIAGVVNPPFKRKYNYRTSLDAKQYKNADEWLSHSQINEGSWWEHWIKWLELYGGGTCRARKPGKGKGGLEDAPGSYVKPKSNKR